MGSLLRDAGLAHAGKGTDEQDPGTRAPSGTRPAAPAADPAASAPRPAASGAPAPPRPRSLRTPGELAAWNEAYRDVTPIRRPKAARVRDTPRSQPVAVGSADGHPGDRAAGERLAALVGGGVRFDVRWDEHWVLGTRQGANRERLTRRLTGRGFHPEATFDLHGFRRSEVAREIDRFVRTERRRGRRFLLLIVGKGHHSEGGVGVLSGAAVEALTEGGAAPLVEGFASAHPVHGGSGALALVLR